MLTNNTKRKADQVDAANPRAENAFGHIIEIAEDGGDFAATKGNWEVLLKCGDPRSPRSAPPSRPDDHRMAGSACRTTAPSIRPAASGSPPTATAPKATGRTDGLWAVDTEGDGARDLEAVLPRAGRRRDVRPAVHAGRPDRLRRRPAPGRRRRGLGALAARPITRTCRPAGPTSTRHAGAAVGRGDHQAGRRQDRRLKEVRHAQSGSLLRLGEQKTHGTVGSEDLRALRLPFGSNRHFRRKERRAQEIVVARGRPRSACRGHKTATALSRRRDPRLITLGRLKPENVPCVRRSRRFAFVHCSFPICI